MGFENHSVFKSASGEGIEGNARRMCPAQSVRRVRRPMCSWVEGLSRQTATVTRILVGMLAVGKKPGRKVRAPRDPKRTRVRLLQAAFQEMHRSGFRSTDLDAILAKAGVTKGALYYHFDNKEALGYAVVDEVIATKVHQKWVQPLRSAKNPIDI